MSNDNKNAPVPPGYMRKSNNDLVAVENIAPVKLLKNDLVNSMIDDAKAMQSLMIEFKQKMWDDFDTFVTVSFEDHGVERGGSKGNITLTSFDGSRKVQLSVKEHVTFDEQLQVAKTLIDKYLLEIVEGVNPVIKTIVMSAFNVNKEGLISTSKMLSLRHYNFDDERWKKAMHIISEALVVTGTKNYIRLYENGENITLDMASL